MNRGGGPSSSHVSIIHNIRINPRSVFTIPRVALELFSIFYLEEIRDISLSLSQRGPKKRFEPREGAREIGWREGSLPCSGRESRPFFCSRRPPHDSTLLLLLVLHRHTPFPCVTHTSPSPPSSSSPSPRLLRRDLRGSLQQRMRAHCVGRDYARACWCVYAPRLGSANHGLTVYSIRGKLNIPTSSGTPKRLFSTLRNGRPRVRLWPQRATM